MNRKTKLIVALDTPCKEEFIRILDATKDLAEYYKIGLIPYTGIGPEAMKLVKRRKKKIFLDLKFYDIPNTMIAAALAGVRQGADLIDFHLSQDVVSLARAIRDIKKKVRIQKYKQPRILGVSVLTSVAGTRNTRAKVLALAQRARQTGCDGAVLSGKEAACIRRKMGEKFIIVCPGIRMESCGDDQKRTVTPEAVRGIADFIVIGRPIYTAKNMHRVCGAICARLD